MLSRTCTLLNLTAAFLATFHGYAETTTSATKPNIVFIISDDHRWDCIGAAGNDKVKTPNLDAIANEGVYFRQGTVLTPQCSPNRASLLTGLPPHQNGWFSNQTQLKKRQDKNGFRDLPTVPDQLSKSGYQTVLVGKWHLPSDPWNCGFSQVRTWLPSGGGKYKNLELAKGNSRERAAVPDFTQDIFGKDAAAFISSAEAKQKPFFLWLALTAPHTPLKPNPQHLEDLYKGKKNNELVPEGFTQGTPDEALTSFSVSGARRGGKGTTSTVLARQQRETQWHDYYTAISSADEQVGRVRDALKQAGLEKNTVIVFLGDNGMMRGSRGWDGKVLPYDESVRVPFVVYAPGIATAKGASEAAVSGTDLSVSFLKWAGAAVPKEWKGRDLTPALKSTTAPGFEHAFAEFADNVSKKFGAIEYRMIREPKAKLIMFKEPSMGDQFFNLEKDPRELRNLIADPAARDKIAEMRKKLETWQKETGDGANYDPSELSVGEGED